MHAIAKAVKNVDEVFVATDHHEIYEFVESFDGKALITNEACENGTVRAYDCLKQLPDSVENIINLQGDAVLTPPYVVQPLVDSLAAETGKVMVTAASKMASWAKYQEFLQAKITSPSSGTTVTIDNKGYALYFSKNVIPNIRKGSTYWGLDDIPVYRHIGLYGYKRKMLEEYINLDPTPLEEAEKLEQLRVLEHGYKIKIVQVDYAGRTPCAIDTPADVVLAEQIIAKEGELIND